MIINYISLKFIDITSVDPSNTGPGPILDIGLEPACAEFLTVVQDLLQPSSQEITGEFQQLDQAYINDIILEGPIFEKGLMNPAVQEFSSR